MWRGVNELYGPTGDPLTGFYDRSPNIHVRDMASFESRRGYERAFDELFHGHAAVLAVRDYSNISYLAVDGEGVKILSSLPQTFFDGFGPDHPGFINDAFTRGNAADIQAGTTLPWIEGQDSEVVATRTALPNLEIHSNMLKLRDPGASTASFADWDIEATTPWHVIQVEIDATGVGFTAAGQEWEVTVFQGIPNFILDDGVVSKARIWGIDGDQTIKSDTNPDHCWAGVAARFRIRRMIQSTLKNRVSLDLFEFGSSETQESRLNRSGKIIYKAIGDRSDLSVNNSEVSWVLEIGRRLVADGWETRADLYRFTTIAALVLGGKTTFINHDTETRRVDGGTGGYYYNLPSGGGFAAVSVRVTAPPATGYIGVTEMKAALDFARFLY